MTIAIDTSNRRRELENLDAGEPAAAQPQQKAASNKPTQQQAWAQMEQGSAQARGPSQTVVAFALQSQGANGDTKAKAAREGIDSVARELSGHGVDTEKVVQQFSSGRYAETSDAKVRSLARQAFIAEALKNHPELADKVNSLRLRGQPAELRAIVQAGLSQVGTTGSSKVATCERMISSLRQMSASDLASVHKNMREGMGFQAAVQAQKQSAAARTTPTDGSSRATSDQLEAAVHSAIGRARTEAGEAKRLMDAVNAQNRQITTVHPVAERTIGAGVSTMIVPEVLGGLYHSAANKAEVGGALMNGELTQKQALVRQAYGACVQTYGRYTEANAQYQQALQRHDYVAVGELSRRCTELGAQLKSEVQVFSQRSTAAKTQENQFDKATQQVVVHALLTAVSLGTSGVAEQAFTSMFGVHAHAVEMAAEIAINMPLEGRVGERISEAVEHVTHHRKAASE